mgnify:CR=1 FL=1
MHNNAFWSNSNAFSLIICKVYTKRENADSWNSGPGKAMSELPILHISKWAKTLWRIVLEYKKNTEANNYRRGPTWWPGKLVVFYDDCVEAFETLKKALTSAPIVQPPDWNLPFEIMCDATEYAVGACRYQNRQISGRGSQTVRLRIEGNRRQGTRCLPRFGPSWWR